LCLKDAVTLRNLKQMGVEGVVTSLHHVKPGEMWLPEEITAGKEQERNNLSVFIKEIIPVAEERGIMNQAIWMGMWICTPW